LTSAIWSATSDEQDDESPAIWSGERRHHELANESRVWETRGEGSVVCICLPWSV